MSIVQNLGTVAFWGVVTPFLLGPLGLWLYRWWCPVRDWVLKYKYVRWFAAATKVLSKVYSIPCIYIIFIIKSTSHV